MSIVPIIFCVVMFWAVVYGWWTVKGSGIAERPYQRRYSDSPGAFGASTVFGRDDRVDMNSWSRGTR
jgi:hypothetical protein